MFPSRPAAVVAVLALAASACAGGNAGDGGGRRAAKVTVPQVRSGPKEGTPSALRNMRDPRLPAPLVNPDDIISGGPPPDGIPAIDRPVFERVRGVDWLRDREPVLALELDGDARAYPVQILVWHEIVNDTVGSTPVSVTYCPLCNSAVAFDRRVAGRVVDFGTSGRLYFSDLVMYDRQTESLWVQFEGRAVAGVLTGERLRAYPVATVSWSDFRKAHPRGLVLSRDTGFSRDYGRNPYPGYDDVRSTPFLFEGEIDGRLAAKERVVGIKVGNDAVAVTLDALARRRMIELEAEGQKLVVFWKPGTAAGLEAGRVSDGRDVGATGVFDPTVDGRRLTFRAVDDGFQDNETGSRWDIFGRATSGPLAGRSLTAIPHVDTFWFAWAAFRPDTTIISR